LHHCGSSLRVFTLLAAGGGVAAYASPRVDRAAADNEKRVKVDRGQKTGAKDSHALMQSALTP